jgi:hypothetical protein
LAGLGRPALVARLFSDSDGGRPVSRGQLQVQSSLVGGGASDGDYHGEAVGSDPSCSQFLVL